MQGVDCSVIQLEQALTTEVLEEALCLPSGVWSTPVSIRLTNVGY